jgi:hypothetical protein
MLERLNEGARPDYGLYFPPFAAPSASHMTGPLTVALEPLLLKAFEPLPMLALDEQLPDESFLTLSEHARILCLVPTDDQHFLHRFRLLKEAGPLGRCVFVMPDNGTLGDIDWPSAWSAARASVAKLGIELSAYTAGGWLFRLDAAANACTFRPITNPNPEKIARAIEAICVEME